MNRSLSLTISTPMEVIVNAVPVVTVRAEDDSGGFGLLPGHTDVLTALPASVVRWRDLDGRSHFCAIRAGLLTLTGGTRVAIACRDAILGDDLQALEEDVRRLRAAQAEADRRVRVEQMRLHAQAVRQMMRFLRPDMPNTFGHPPSAPFEVSGREDG